MKPVKGIETIVTNVSYSESNDDDDSVTLEYNMPSLRIKNDDETSDKESSNDDYNKESENDADNLPVVEDVIGGDEDESPSEPTGRGHRDHTQLNRLTYQLQIITCTQRVST